MNLEVLSSMILGNTGKLYFSSIKMCKEKKTCIRRGNSLGILDVFRGEMKGGDLVLYKITFLVAFGENWASRFAN